MAVSLTTRPSTWSAVKNPVVYKFTSTGHGALVNYRIEVEVFRASDNTSLTDGVKLSYSPNADGITYADISSIVKAFLIPEWDNPSSLNEVQEDASLKVYIKYQELYDGSATSVVNDVASPFHCVLGGLNIERGAWGNEFGNSLIQFTPEDSGRKFLSLFEQAKLWRDYPATVSFIYPAGLSALYLHRSQYDAAGTLIGETYSALNSGNEDAVNILDLNSAVGGFSLNALASLLKIRLASHAVGAEIFANPSFVGSLAPWGQDGSGNLWTWNAAEYAIADLPSMNLEQTLSPNAAGWYVLEYDLEPSVADCTLTIEAFNSAALVQTLVNTTIASASRATYSSLVYIASVFNQIKLSSDPPAGIPNLKVYSFSLKAFSPVSITEQMTFEVTDACDNPILLIWKNSLGGDAFWLFDVDQEVSYQLSEGKAKRMVLYTNNLTSDQWEALNELNHVGEVYKENITEFTSSVNKSHKQDGAQVYMVEADGTKRGVIVIPTNNVMFSRMRRHQFRIEIELPQRYE